jgi:hypothetical protein
MPTVDFTLEDIGKQTERIVDRMLDEKLDRMLDEKLDRMLDQKLDRMLDQRFEQERAYTRAMVEEIIENLWEDNLAPAFNEIHQDLKGLHQIVDQHSRDIMELRSRVRVV